MKASEILYLSEKDVKKCITMKDTIEAVEEGMRVLGEGKAVQPPKIYMNIDKYHGFIKPMIAYVGDPMNVSATKNFSFFPDNKKYGLPTVMATIILNDSRTGAPIAYLDGAWITALRTAASSAIAAKYLAKKNSKVVAIIGAGVEGRSHAMALNEIFKIDEIRVSSRSKGSRERYAKEVSELLDLNVTPMDSVRQAVKGADISCTVTTANEILIKKEWVEPGMFIAKTGSYQEIDFDIIMMVDKLVVDWWEYASTRVPEIATPLKEGKIKRESIYAEIAEIVAGKKKGRKSNSEKILFVSIGMGVEDAATALRAYQNAMKHGIGQKLNA